MLTLFLLAACTDTTVSGTTGCSLGVPTIAPSTAAPGDQVVLTATPLTEVWDTAITVGAARAAIVGVDRSTCTDCDDCKDTGGCAVCGECSTCDEACATCVETVTFTVPELAPGTWAVELVNQYGRTEKVDLVVTAAADTGADTSTP